MLSAEDTIDTAKNNNPIRLWINDGRWTGNRFVESEMANAKFLRDWTPSDSGTPITGISATESQGRRVAYASSSYETQLSNNDCYMDDSELGVAEESKLFCKSLLKLEQIFPEHSLFSDDLFVMTFKSLKNKNEMEIIRLIGQLIVPQVAVLAIQGSKHLNILEESANKGWECSIPLIGAHPQPGYSVGFKKKAFTDLQLTNLSPFLCGILEGNLGRSFFTTTPEMLFPFLACEVTGGTVSLDTADRQNAHSMTLAVRGIVLLFCLVQRQKELDRTILAFSISHDHDSARIYGHYPVFDESGAFRYFRHEIAKFFLAGEEGKNRWKAYQFTKNIYDVWMPEHLKRIQSAIDQFPDEWDFNAPKLSYVSSAARKLRVAAEQGNVQVVAEQGEGVSTTLPINKESEPNCGSKRDVETASPVALSSCKKQKTSASES